MDFEYGFQSGDQPQFTPYYLYFNSFTRSSRTPGSIVIIWQKKMAP